MNDINQIIGHYKNHSKHRAEAAKWLEWLDDNLGQYPNPVVPWDAYVFCHKLSLQKIPNCRINDLKYYAGPKWTMHEIMVVYDEGPHTYANYFNIVMMGDDLQAVQFKLANS